MDVDNTRITDLTFGHVIRLIREIAVVFVCCYLSIKVFSGDLSLDFTKLTATELVSFLLAFFSIGLSAAFYFAATNSSNKFYDYINKFNSSMSELLGRLEERIKNVNEKQHEIGVKISGGNYSETKSYDADLQAKNNEAAIDEVQAAFENTIKDILAKAALGDEEKRQLEASLRKAEVELSELRNEQSKITAKKILSLKRYITQKVEDFGLEQATALGPDELLIALFGSFSPPARRDLHKYGYVMNEFPDGPGDVTREGRELVFEIVVKLLEKANEKTD
jgi:hypothetical protein